MKKKVLVCQHVPHEPLGSLNLLLKHHGYRIKYVNFSRHPEIEPSIEDYSGLIVLGGPMNVDQQDKYPFLKTELKLIESALNKEVPVLGVCLGSQLLASALGAPVRKNPVKEVGWYDLHVTDIAKSDSLFAHFGEIEKIFQWHGCTFDIPESALHLASSPDCSNQAFRYGDNVYGFQFHLEVDRELIYRWLHVESNAADVEEMGGQSHRDRVLSDTQQHIEKLSQLAHITFEGFIDLLGGKKVKRVLPSR